MNSKNVVAEVSVVPLGTGSTSVSDFVAACVDVLDKHKLISYLLTPMGTILEGPLDEVLQATREMHEVPFNRGAMRVVTTLKIDERRDKALSMEGKLASVRKKRPSVRT